jgi:peroxiredoxin (alkyl hydroperoxide reductase subunit C)
MIEAGQPAPGFTLRNQDGEDVSLSDFSGQKVLLVFYPFDFSALCSDQLSLYEEIKPQLGEKGVEMLGISIDHPFAHKAFQEKLGVDTTLLADFEPKGEVAGAYGSYNDQIGMANRNLVLIDEDGNVEWVHESPSAADIPPPQAILDALAAA